MGEIILGIIILYVILKLLRKRKQEEEEKEIQEKFEKLYEANPDFAKAYEEELIEKQRIIDTTNEIKGSIAKGILSYLLAKIILTIMFFGLLIYLFGNFVKYLKIWGKK